MLPLLMLVACAKKGHDSSGPADTGTPVDRGPTTVPVDGDPNGLWWDVAGERLLVADDDNNRILGWTDTGGIALVGDLPAASAEGAGLGQLVVTSDGTIVVTRFGYGKYGDVAMLASDGTGSVVSGLDVERRRIGLTIAADGTLYDTWFISGDAGRAGAVSRLSLDGGEVDVVPDLTKPVGVLASGDSLYVSDQDQKVVLKSPLSDPASVSALATIDSPDLLCAGPDGSLFTGGSKGDVRKIGADGSVSTFASGYQQVRGVAYDAAHHRLFVVDHDGDDKDGTTNYLQILPVD